MEITFNERCKAIRSNIPLPSDAEQVYAELKILKWNYGNLFLGLAGEQLNVDYNEAPGMDVDNSIGLTASSGNLFINKSIRTESYR